MMRVLFLLSALVCAGLAVEMYYGSTFRIRLLRRAQSLDFHSYTSNTDVVLWRRYEPLKSRYRKFGLEDDFFLIRHLTPADSGLYRLRNAENSTIYTTRLDVISNHQEFTVTAGEVFSFSVDLPSSSCNIYHSSGSTAVVVRKGSLEYFFYDFECKGIELYESCGISIESVEKGCGGKFTVRDDEDHEIMHVLLTVEAAPIDVSKIGIGFGVSFGISLCCCCMKKCCCGKKKKKNQAETSEEEPAVHYHEYDHEPVGSGHVTHVTTETNSNPPAYVAVASVNSTPNVVMPPPYSEVTGLEEPPEGPATFAPATFAPATLAPTALAPTALAPTVLPLSSDPEPRYQINFRFPSAAPLSSDTEFSSVYTSDKLNLGSGAASDCIGGFRA